MKELTGYKVHFDHAKGIVIKNLETKKIEYASYDYSLSGLYENVKSLFKKMNKEIAYTTATNTANNKFYFVK